MEEVGAEMSIYNQAGRGDADAGECDPRERHAINAEKMAAFQAETRQIRGGVIGLNSDTPKGPEMERVVKDMEDAIQTLGMLVVQVRDRLQPILMHDQEKSPGGELKRGLIAQSDLAGHFESRSINIRGTNDVLRNILDRLAI